MGKFDFFETEFECPYCHQKSLIEFQTKSLDCELRQIEIGEFVNVDIIHVYGDCHSPECQTKADKYNCSIQQMASNAGAIFEAQLEVIEKTITGNIINVSIKPYYSDEYLESIKTKWSPYFNKRSNRWFEENWKKV
jgi:hypothetical protein